MMTTFTNETFSGQDLLVDGNSYSNCVFENSVLIFEGGSPPTFNNCEFKNIKIQLRGQAAKTTNYLNALVATGLPAEVDSVIMNVQSGVVSLPNRPNPPPAENVGKNYSQLAWISLGLVIAAGWFIFMYAWGTVIDPYQKLANGNFLRTEVSFDLIPRLPDALADEYDARRDAQLARINEYGVADTDGNVTIPIDDAITLILEEGLPVRDEAAAEEESSDESSE